MRPYNGDRNKHRTINRDDIHHGTADLVGRDPYAKRGRKAARQTMREMCRRCHEEHIREKEKS
jgi:hypothetical protein